MRFELASYAVLLALLVLLSEYGYKIPAWLRGDAPAHVEYLTLLQGSVVKEKSWLYYILHNVQDICLWLLALPLFRKASFRVWLIGTTACVLGVWNSFESSLCAAASIGHTFADPVSDHLCTARFGSWFGPCLALTLIIAMLLKGRGRPDERA